MRLLCAVTILGIAVPLNAQIRLADESDRAAFRSWFVLLADAQFEQPAAEVTDCAALVRFAFREALRPHTTEWARRLNLPRTPSFADVRSAPLPTKAGWGLFRVSGGSLPRYAEFADARTLVQLNTRPLGRDTSALAPGDLLYFHQPAHLRQDSGGQGPSQPDHLMVFVGRSFFDPGDDWVVYHTGPSADGPGEVRKVRLADLERHPAPRWRPVASNQQFVGVFRLAAL
jgi:uncharacterized protein